MRNYIFNILTLLFLTFLTSCLTAETTDSPTENQATNSQTKPGSNKNELIKQALTEIINDGQANSDGLAN